MSDALTQQAVESIDMRDVKTVLYGGELIHQHMYFLLRNSGQSYKEQNFTNPDLVILNYNQTYPNEDAFEWPDYIQYKDVPWEWVDNNMKLVYCNEYTYVWKTTN